MLAYPRSSASLSVSYTLPSVSEHYDWHMNIDAFSAQNDPILSQKAYSVFNASLVLKQEHTWTLSFYGKNLGDKNYFSHDIDLIGLDEKQLLRHKQKPMVSPST